MVRLIHAAHVGIVGIQPGAVSKKALRYCGGNGISVVSRECIMARPHPLSG